MATPPAIDDSADLIDLSIVVPAYRSEKTLPALVAAIDAAIGGRYSLELILVNDRSPDGSWKVASELARTHSWVRALNLRKNVGQHMAIFAGLRECRGRVIVTMDDDLQHAPSDIPTLVEALDDDHDVCYGSFLGRKHAAWKILGSHFNDRVATWLLEKPKGLYLSPFKAMKRGVRNEVVQFRGPAIYLDGLILSATSRVTTRTVGHHAREDGTSGYSLKKSISLWLKMATSFSVAPLRMASLTGMTISAAGFLFAAIIVIHKLLDPGVAVGWSSLIVAILIMGGVQLLALGAIGEYVGRILLNFTTPTQYSIAERVDSTVDTGL
ncbi:MULTISPECIES: glycosyltransferase family 2 protein [unclassified Stenotrophomonas]|uniref:glycosyltransferase family 2 protein n=1 Tax=unclassified Stenotrophomonas TaxID=196198 RepID=UPI000FAB5544